MFLGDGGLDVRMEFGIVLQRWEYGHGTERLGNFCDSSMEGLDGSEMVVLYGVRAWEGGRLDDWRL